jgi:hypothetical protein
MTLTYGNMYFDPSGTFLYLLFGTNYLQSTDISDVFVYLLATSNWYVASTQTIIPDRDVCVMGSMNNADGDFYVYGGNNFNLNIRSMLHFSF